MEGSSKVYVTTVGTSPEAVFNPLWYLVEVHSWIPDRVYLLWNDGVRDQLEDVKRLIKRLSSAYGVGIEIIAGDEQRFSEENPVEFRRKVGHLVGSLKRDGYEVVVDITPGRKFMSALLLGVALSANADEITYLHLDDWKDYIGKLLFEVPMTKQRLFRKVELTGKAGTAKLGKRKREGSGAAVSVEREKLMAVLDSLYIDGVRRFPLKVRGKTIGDVILGDTAKLRVSNFINLDDELHGGHAMVREAVIAGGMAKFRNWEELVSLVRRLKGDGRPLYIGFDTNALYFRVPSKILGEKRFRARGNLIFDFVYSDEVAVEVGKHLNKKLPYGKGLGIYSNQPTPRARLASLGRVELNRLRNLGAERADGGGEGQGDTKIALDYRAFAEEKHANVLVITLDEGAYAEMDALKGTGLIPFRLEWDFGFGDTLDGTWEELRDTLYTLAVTLGELNVHSYKLYGIWNGKKTEDWESERVKLTGFEYTRIFRVLS